MALKSFLFSYYKSFIIFLLILIASLIPASEVQKVSWISIPNFDKLIHLGMYFCFTSVLIFDTFRARVDFSVLKIYVISALTALIYGGLLEIIQGALTKSRSADIFDFLCNTTGALLAVALWMIFKRSK
jgi:VanZ family protein